MTESELIEACLRNDRIAQRTLYDRYKRAMYTLAYRTTSDFDEANDVFGIPIFSLIYLLFYS